MFTGSLIRMFSFKMIECVGTFLLQLQCNWSFLESAIECRFVHFRDQMVIDLNEIGVQQMSLTVWMSDFRDPRAITKNNVKIQIISVMKCRVKERHLAFADLHSAENILTHVAIFAHVVMDVTVCLWCMRHVVH